jgi:hypothetical protein
MRALFVPNSTGPIDISNTRHSRVSLQRFNLAPFRVDSGHGKTNMPNRENAPLSALQSESDVEQKFIYPLLTNDEPHGLGIDPSAVLTKPHIRRFVIGKGASKKSYFPDYIVAIGGFPIVIVEAKRPGEDLAEAYNEARLYASELNAIYPHGINPVSRIIATDGGKFICGPSDINQPVHQMEHLDFEPYSQKWAELVEFIGHKALSVEQSRLSELTRPKEWRKPRALMGGLFTQSEEIEHNTFGTTVSKSLGQFFNPITREDRAYIAQHGYVASLRRDRLIEPIDPCRSSFDARRCLGTAHWRY